ncbi:FAD-dependent oxidoreductase [Pedobacter sp. GSP4]|uniref:FAD-dependent oxidoreductase n=1 Tax=Pedobacter sp. GSP4 TaxID=3453716 RepID=UPI003EEBE302
MDTSDINTKRRDGANTSIWEAAAQRLTVPADAKNNQVYDALIVGAGITGLTTGLLLAQQGKACLIVEAHSLGFGTSGGTTAHLNTFLDATYPEIDSDFSPEASRQLASATSEIIEMIRKNIETFSIEADFEYKQAYLYSQNKKESDQLSDILQSSKAAGLHVDQADQNGLPIPFEKAIRFEKQAQFHPIKYLLGLAKAFKDLGGEIIENTFVNGSEKADGIHMVNTGSGKFKAKHIVYATHIPPGINILSLRNAPYRSYVLGVKLKNGPYPDALCYDMQEPYHYFRTHQVDGEQYLIAGGEDHKTGHGDPEQALINLEDYLRKYFDISEVSFKWSSQYYVPVDGLPYIGQLPAGDEGIFVATGFNGNGMILGSLSGRIISDEILGRENELTELLSPSRLKPLSGFKEFIKENADVAYHFLADRFGAAEQPIADLPKGSGKLLEVEGEELAVYKDPEGKVTALNPVCTHAGCIVQWNPTELSWDCPCHGGRFCVQGKVLTGPPRKDLEQIELKKP